MTWSGLYLFCIAFGAVLIGVSLVFGGFEADADVDVDADADVDVDADAEADGGGWGFSIVPFASLRFWTFLVEAFGLAGAVLSLTGLPNSVVFSLALSFGGIVGYAAYLFFRWLTRESVSGATTFDSLVGSEAKAMLNIRKGALGQVQYDTPHGSKRLPARTGDDKPIKPGDTVLIAAVEDGVAMVTRLGVTLPSESSSEADVEAMAAARKAAEDARRILEG